MGSARRPSRGEGVSTQKRQTAESTVSAPEIMEPRARDNAKELTKPAASGDRAFISSKAPESSQRSPAAMGRKLLPTGKERLRGSASVTLPGAPRLSARKRRARPVSSTGSAMPQGLPGTTRPVSASKPYLSCIQRSRKAPQPPARASQGQKETFFMRNALREIS